MIFNEKKEDADEIIIKTKYYSIKIFTPVYCI